MFENEYAKQRVEAIRKRVAGPPEQREEDLTPEDRNILIEFDEKLTSARKKNNRCGWYHHANLLQRLFVFALETGRLAESLEDGSEGDDALDDITTWIHDQDYSGYTVQGMLSTLRVFANTVRGELPEHFQDIEPSEHVEKDPAPLPSNIIEYPDLVTMLEETDSVRDRALLATQWSVGLRPMEELYTLQWKNVELFDDHAMISLPKRRKTEHREVIVIVGAPLLRQWIKKHHPVHDDPEASLGPETFIWTHQNKNELLSYSAFGTRFTVAGERAEIEKDHSAQHFRRSAASIMARQPHITERDLRQRFSWSYRSYAPEHYIQMHSEDTHISVARSRGQDVDKIEEDPDTAPIICPNCGDWTLRLMDACIWCNHDMDPEQTTWDRPTMQDPRDTGEKDLAEMILDGDITADQLRTLRQLEGAIKTERDLWSKLDDLIQKAEALEEAKEHSGDNVSSLLGVAGVVGHLSAAATEAAEQWSQTKHAALKIHPEFEHYPPRGPRLVGLVSAWAVLLGVSVAVLLTGGVLEELVAGEPVMLFTAIVALAVGGVLVERDLPSIEDALDAAVEE